MASLPDDARLPGPAPALSPEGSASPFASPAHDARAQVSWRALARFTLQRTIRMLVAPTVLVTIALLVLQIEPAPWLFLGLVAIGIGLYLPTTAVLFRSRFLPRDPEQDELLLHDGSRMHAGDYLAAVWATAAEQVLAGLPLVLLALFGALHAGLLGALIGSVGVALAAFTALAAAVDAAIGVSVVHLARERPGPAARPLERLLRLPLPARLADPLLQQLGVVRFRQGDLDGLGQVARAIRSPSPGMVWLRAHALVARDPDAARALIATAPTSAEAEALGALVALEGEQPELVTARKATWEAERATAPLQQARFRDLLLAAALAPQAPDEARRLLRRSRWSADRLPWMRTVWPSVAARLARAAPW